MSEGIGQFIVGVSAIGIGAVALGYQQIVDLASPVVLDVPPDTVLAAVIAECAPVRYRDDGGVPTRDVGMPLDPGRLRLFSALGDLRFIEQRPRAILNVAYYGAAP